MTDNLKPYDNYIQSAINALKQRSYPQAEESIKQAMLINPHSSVVHNLYGIFEELLMKDNLARKHYRAAYALDPTYKPAIRNLERISTFEYYLKRIPIDFGDQPEEETEDTYPAYYDNPVMHLCKKKKE
ncbi:hypothetical protein [Lutispora saccharofermentans]|uniref:Tetratricopeptide repeat protein n=1 Tax=Lutispora saccharofermentans TaxID=3024236 RepID=A0ABT1NE17_9FIRM|nr:hypothetical protein [Lutispora saccharofermentans]MCQ1529477.1 hypothetical protein [Lutispora saccharofermentans]